MSINIFNQLKFDSYISALSFYILAEFLWLDYDEFLIILFLIFTPVEICSI